MSKNKSLNEIKAELDQCSPTFCLAKWTQLNLDLASGQTASCCLVERTPVEIDSTISVAASLHNTQHKIKERQQLLEGKKPAGCRACWVNEENGAIHSDRHSKSSRWWNEGQLDLIMSDPLNVDYIPPYVEVNLGNICQMKCTYCSPELSSAWEEEARQYGPFQTQTLHGILPQKNQARIDHAIASWRQWLPQNIDKLKVLRLTGGEPVLNPLYHECLELLQKGSYPNLSFAINSNLCIPERYWKKYINDLSNLIDSKQVKQVSIYTSLEGIGAAGEYMRSGLDYKLWKKRLESILTEIPALDISIMATYNILAVEGFLDFLKQVEQWKILKRTTSPDAPPFFMNISPLYHPDFMSAYFQDSSLAACLNSQIDWLSEKVATGSDFEEIELGQLMAIERAAKSHQEDKLNHQKKWHELKIFLEQLDQRRSTSYQKTFPLLYEALK